MAWQDNLAWPRLVLFMVVMFVLLSAVSSLIKHRQPLDLSSQPGVVSGGSNKNQRCPVPDALLAAADSPRSSELFNKTLQIERLVAAVNVPTVSSNDNGDVDTDPRWEAFARFHTVLEQLFPKVHAKTEVEKINKYGLLYTLKGVSDDLQPVVFMAHQDVVPVADASKWTSPPFEAHYDSSSDWLWGRGSVDCKNNLIGILSALEELLNQGYQNSRTIILSFGFDEEIGGQRGAKRISEHLSNKLGNNSIAMILDEGGMGIEQIGGVAYARPAIAEKGFVDIRLRLEMLGGHSSKPKSPHTAIGIMARIIEKIEDNAPEAHIDKANPFLNVLECQAEHSPHDIEPWLQKELRTGKDLAQRIIDSRGEDVQWSFRTSQAVDVITGGVADNQLPEAVDVVINYRVLPSDDMGRLFQRVGDVVAPVAREFNIGISGFGFSDTRTENGLLTLTSEEELPASPVTKTGADVGIWKVFAGTIRQVFEGRDPSVKLVVPVGDIMTGNTDTVHYWALSNNIYRFSTRWQGTSAGVHTVDERIQVRAHMEGVQFYYELMRNLDKAI